ncbi:MAG TPA: hypothetical protein VMA73_23970 [Streptosporangiaceae bacterium]|nr:hypothetical protein [Streptosporangiaceae bacterium]
MTWLLMHHGKNLILLMFWALMIWSFWYAGIRWNASDEEWLHRTGECSHSHKGCDDYCEGRHD